MSNSPFKMQGFSGFGNSPLKTRGHGGKKGHGHSKSTPADSFMRTTYHEEGYPKKKKRSKPKKAFKYTKAGKLFRKVFGGGGSRGGSSTRLGCGPGSCS
tara:strand:- start:1957 stop:2253 length:297 start_codon:yes stop_codon:yes gene_type:complete